MGILYSYHHPRSFLAHALLQLLRLGLAFSFPVQISRPGALLDTTDTDTDTDADTVSNDVDAFHLKVLEVQHRQLTDAPRPQRRGGFSGVRCR